MRQPVERPAVHDLPLRHGDHGEAERDKGAAPSRIAFPPCGVGMVKLAVVLRGQLRLGPAKVACAMFPVGYGAEAGRHVDAVVELRFGQSVPAQAVRQAQQHGQRRLHRRGRSIQHVAQSPQRLLPPASVRGAFDESPQLGDRRQRRVATRCRPLVYQDVRSAQLVSQHYEPCERQPVRHLQEAELRSADEEPVACIDERPFGKDGAKAAEHARRSRSDVDAAHQRAQGQGASGGTPISPGKGRSLA